MLALAEVWTSVELKLLYMYNAELQLSRGAALVSTNRSFVYQHKNLKFEAAYPQLDAKTAQAHEQNSCK